MSFETVITMNTSRIKYGVGATREVGHDLKSMGAKRVMLVVDPNLTQSEAVSSTLSALHSEGIDAVLFDAVRIEPTDVSFKEAIRFATDGRFDGYVAVGGGSTMDTAAWGASAVVHGGWRERRVILRTTIFDYNELGAVDAPG